MSVLLDPAAMIERAWATTSMPGAGLCLRFVDECFGTPRSRLRSGSGDPDAPADGAWMDAQQGWWYCEPQWKFPGEALDAPPGSEIFYSQMIGGHPAGHIAAVVSWGVVRTTYGTGVRTQSIASLNAERRSIRGDGSSSVLGYTIAHGNNPIAGLGAPEPAKEEEKKVPDMELIQAENRGIAVVGPGYFKGLTEEELPYAVKRYGLPRYIGNEREFDLERAIHTNGQTASDDELAQMAARSDASFKALEALYGKNPKSS